MLIVAPSGKTNDATSSDTPRFCWAFFIVTGNAAALDDVENATSCAGTTPGKKWRSLSGVNSLRSIEYVTREWTTKPISTVKQYSPRAANN